MAEHPFHGNWKSYGRNDAEQLFYDGTIDLDIVDGRLRSGYHTPVDALGNPLAPIPLREITITETELHVQETIESKCSYHGFLLVDPFTPSRKITAGGYRIPNPVNLGHIKGSEGRSPSALAQDNGVWVATQP